MNSVKEKIPNKSCKTELENLEAIFNHCFKCETNCNFKKVSQYALKIGLDKFLIQKEESRLPINISYSLASMQKAMICHITDLKD